jgi:hypothetical protein
MSTFTWDDILVDKNFAMAAFESREEVEKDLGAFFVWLLWGREVSIWSGLEKGEVDCLRPRRGWGEME